MILITAVGEDRPGMVHGLASKLAEAGCNIEDTTMTRLSGEFSMILVVSPPQSLEVSALAEKLAPLEASHGLFINCKSFDAPTAPESDLPRYVLTVYGPEKPGLVAGITGVLTEHGVNITDVQTRVASAGAVYIMIFEIEMPPGLSSEALHEALTPAAATIGVQISLNAIEEDYL